MRIFPVYEEGLGRAHAGQFQPRPNLVTRGLRALAAPAKTYEIDGADTSHWSGKNYNWDLIQLMLSFMIAKVSEGNKFQDSCFQYTWQGAKERKIPRGGYHFYRPQYSYKIQGDWFVSLFEGDYGELPMWCDVEVAGIDLNQVHGFCNYVQDKTGHRCGIYTAKYIWLELGGAAMAWAKQFDLWVANYKVSTPALPQPWASLTIPWWLWQFTDGGDGAKYGFTEEKACDLNHFHGTLAQFNTWAGVTSTPTPTEKTDAEKLGLLWGAHPELH